MIKEIFGNKYVVKTVQIAAVVILTAVVVCTSNYFSDKTMEKDAATAAITQTPIKIFIKGAVENSGVYELHLNDRVIDAVQMAGAAADADLEKLDLAAFLNDGETINVPSKTQSTEEAAAEKTSGNTAVSLQGRININTATLEQLKTLNGIGDAIAQRIIDYRTAHGAFGNVNDLLAVSGIGEKRLESIRDYICAE